MDVVAEPLLLGTLRRDYGDGIFKFLAPCDAARLERALPSDLVFVAAGAGVALLRAVAGRRHAEAAKAGAAMLVPLGERRAGRATWATELLWVYVVAAQLRMGGAKKMTSAGAMHSLVTTTGNDGGVWSFGAGQTGRLGHGGEGTEAVPRLVEALSRTAVRQVVASTHHSMALTRDGSVFSWGMGSHGQLGHGNTATQNAPKRVDDLADVVDIAAGHQHSLAVVGKGGAVSAVFAWGSCYYGQLGLGVHGSGGNSHLVPHICFLCWR